MGMIIRVAFNNQNWAGNCKNADQHDRGLFKCWKNTLKTGYKIDENGNCMANCWESTLCTEYSWLNKNGYFDTNRAKGNVFFVFPAYDNSLVLWGKSRVSKVIGDKIYFNKFKPMPAEKWIRDLPANFILGKNWGHGTFRYIDSQIENKLKNLINENFEDSIETMIADKEGRVLLKKHLFKERSTKLVSLFKKSLSSFNCCICEFNFENNYGPIGREFIEVHHTKPVASLKENEIVSIDDLIAVCSNCHRMLHRNNPPSDWLELKTSIERNIFE